MSVKPALCFNLLSSFNVEAIMTAHRKNIEAMTAINQAAFESMQLLAARQTEFMRQGFVETMGVVTAMMASPRPQEHIVRQVEASKATVDKCIANARHIAETVTNCNCQAMETVSRRVSEGIEELRDMVKSAPAAA